MWVPAEMPRSWMGVHWHLWAIPKMLLSSAVISFQGTVSLWSLLCQCSFSCHLFTCSEFFTFRIASAFREGSQAPKICARAGSNLWLLLAKGRAEKHLQCSTGKGFQTLALPFRVKSQPRGSQRLNCHQPSPRISRQDLLQRTYSDDHSLPWRLLNQSLYLHFFRD